MEQRTQQDGQPSRRRGAFLLGGAVWTAYQWLTFIRNLARDERGRPRRFYVVHAALIAANLVFAGALGRLGLAELRAAGGRRSA